MKLCVEFELFVNCGCFCWFLELVRGRSWITQRRKFILMHDFAISKGRIVENSNFCVTFFNKGALWVFMSLLITTPNHNEFSWLKNLERLPPKNLQYFISKLNENSLIFRTFFKSKWNFEVGFWRKLLWHVCHKNFEFPHISLKFSI